MNDDLFKKFVQIERAIVESKGVPFRLFGLSRRTGGFGGWDIIVSSEWGDGSSREIIGTVAREMYARLTKKELQSISRVVDMETNSDLVREMEGYYRSVRPKASSSEYIEFNTINSDGELVEYCLILPRDSERATVDAGSNSSVRSLETTRANGFVSWNSGGEATIGNPHDHFALSK
jgi:hypothetical protein